MQPNQLPPPTLVTQSSHLKSLARSLSGERIVAVDTESNSLYAYQEQVCLVQFSIPSGDYLVDPLVLLDLNPLAALFADPRIEKIFHAAEYDLICLHRDFGFTFANLFDTMLAARILGLPKVGLGSLLESEFGVKLDKRYQRADWGRRPLPADQLAYARMDTHYLIELRNRLEAALHMAGRWALAQEDFMRLTAINEKAVESEVEEEDVSIRASRDLTPQQNAVLLELHKYRDKIARLQDRPLFKVFGDKTLMAIAEACPANLEALSHLPGMSARQVKRHGTHLLEAVQRGLKAEPLRPERPRRPDERLLQRLDSLREWRKRTAKGMHVESDVVLPRDVMSMIASRNPASEEALADLMSDIPWRLEHFGDQILNTLNHSN